MMKRSIVWTVERSDWFGECETVNGSTFHTKREAEAFAQRLRKAAEACEDPEDQVVYTVASEVWEREA